MQPYKAFNTRFRKKSLLKIYYENIHFTSSSGVDGVKACDEFDINSEIDIILRKIRNGSYKFSRYKEKLISKGAGKSPRVISIPTVRDRIVIKALHLTLQDVYPECSKTLIPQLMLEKIKLDVKKLKYKSFVKIDIKEFYPSIEHDLLFNALSSRIKKASFKDLLFQSIQNTTGSIECKKGIPQGLSISNILAEVYLKDIDSKNSSDKKNSYYRYVDDVLIFSKSKKTLPLVKRIIDRFDSIGLDCHPYDEINSKTKYGLLSDEFDFLGYLISNRELTVKPESIHRIEMSIAKIISSVKYVEKPNFDITQNKLNIRITGCIFEGKRRGWLFYYSQLEDLQVLYKLDSTVKTLLKKAGLSEEIKQKKFSKTYGECNRVILENYKYILNFDVYTVAEKREYLAQIMELKTIASLDDSTVDAIFQKRIRHLVNDLDQDLRNNS
ncbi:reverse transcriptase domain-containing protein [Psychromonas ossibalaenae]|uniref:reverse transcriptase domain-containing protein n=1 Tax=Psychromonas ossibalaenae TaxID=444922 RepID=UPI00035F0223|nr:reverse transcriptase domain-containing protein [Psychromonas ossibalaenae]